MPNIQCELICYYISNVHLKTTLKITLNETVDTDVTHKVTNRISRKTTRIFSFMIRNVRNFEGREK